MERPAVGTLELVIRTIPAALLDFVTAIREELVEQIVVRAGFGCHTCYGMPWHYLCLLLPEVGVTRVDQIRGQSVAASKREWVASARLSEADPWPPRRR